MYPYKVGDRVMIGIATWQYPRDPDQLSFAQYEALSWDEQLVHARRKAHGPSGPHTRYFIGATVVANDREAGILVIDADKPFAGGSTLDVYRYADFDGEEIVPYNEALPQTAADAHHRALCGEIN